MGGWVTTNASWRYVFAGETVIVTVIILLRGQIAQAPKAEHIPKMDIIGSVLSVAGLGLAVFGILMGSKWGFVKPLGALSINGTKVTPLGFSIVPFMVLAGLGILAGFVHWEERRQRLGLDRLLDTALLRITQLRAGLTTLLGQQLVLMGLFFVVPVYLQVVIGLDAFETGKRLLPLSAAMLVFALVGPKIAGRRSPRTVAQAGLILISAGAVVMLATLEVKLNDTGFKIAMVLVGAGGGLLASQLGNVIMSSTDPSEASETGGLQGTALNLGASIGTALIGAILILNLINGFNDNVGDSPQVPPPTRDAIAANTEEGIDIVPTAEVEQRALSSGLSEDQGNAVADDYGDAQLDALRISVGAVAAIALLCLWFTRKLPTAGIASATKPDRDAPTASA